MIAVKRVLSFDEFAASNRITLLHGPIGRKLNFILCGYVLPILGVAALPFVGWLAVRAWHEPGDHAGLFGVLCGMLAMCAYYALYPLLFLRKMKTLYRQQQLDREWEIEISERGIHSKLIGLADTHLEWAYFDFYVDTPGSFVLLKKLRPVFLTVQSIRLDAAQRVELRGLLDSHLIRKGDPLA